MKKGNQVHFIKPPFHKPLLQQYIRDKCKPTNLTSGFWFLAGESHYFIFIWTRERFGWELLLQAQLHSMGCEALPNIVNRWVEYQY